MGLLEKLRGPLPPYEPEPAAADEDPYWRAALIATINELRLPGLQLAVQWPDGRRRQAAAGTIDRRRRFPLRVHHLLGLGSITKIYTAALVLRLAEEGRLALDDPLEHALPFLPNAGEITVRRLLNHTSGLVSYLDDPRFRLRLLVKPRVSTTDMLRFAARLKPAAAPGQIHLYSNTNYAALALLIEQATGRKVGELLAEHFFRPWKLAATCLPEFGARPAGLAGGIDRSFLPFGPPPIPARVSRWTAATSAAGGLFATAADVLTWLTALFGGRVLQPASLAAMTDFLEIHDEKNPPKTGAGLGLFRYVIDGVTYWGHAGSVPGYSSIALVAPDRGFYLAAITNFSQFRTVLLFKRILAFSGSEI